VATSAHMELLKFHAVFGFCPTLEGISGFTPRDTMDFSESRFSASSFDSS